MKTIVKYYSYFCAFFLVPAAIIFGFIVLDYYSPTEVENFIRSKLGTIFSISSALLISFLALLTAYLSSASSEKQREADRLLNTELKLSDFRQAWIDVLRKDCSQVVSISYSFFDDKETQLSKLAELKGLEAHIRLRLNPLDDAIVERNIEKLLVRLISALEISQKRDCKCFADIKIEDVVIKRREAFAELSAQLLKKEWDVLKDNLDKLKAGE